MLISLSVVPFWIIPLAHLASGPTATGFYQYELPYYVANGRAAFARGDSVDEFSTAIGYGESRRWLEPTAPSS